MGIDIEMEFEKKGILIVVSAPSGSGKGTVLSHLTEDREHFALSVSLTTRKPRTGEIDGIHYFFVSKEDFLKEIENGNMLEYAEYCGNYYGTPKDRVDELLSNGINVILEIETVGAMKIKKLCPDAIFIMILPPSFSALEKRLRSRGTNSVEDIQKRLETAVKELSCIEMYDYVVINRDGKSKEAADTITGIAMAEKCRVKRNPELISDFYDTKPDNEK